MISNPSSYDRMDQLYQTESDQSNCDQSYTVCSTNGFIDLDPIKDYCFIDDETAKTLELIQNNVDSSNRKHSLYGFLNVHTNTTTGARLLRQTILNPFCNYEVIDHRLDCVDYLVSRIDILASLTNCIRKYGVSIDLDHVVPCLINLCKTRQTTLSVTEKRLDALTTLETLLSQVDPLVAALELTDQPTLNIYKLALMDPAFSEILTEISNIVDSDVKIRSGKRGKVFRIKRGVEAVFDIARNTYNIAISDMEQYVKELQRKDGLPWRLAFTEGKGYFLTLYVNQMPKGANFGPIYMNIDKTRTTISCTTVDLMKSNVRARISYQNSMALANEILTACLNSIVRHANSLKKLTSVIGMLDLITCFAKVANNSHGRMTRPIFTPTDTIVNASRHPVLESILNVNNILVVPNDIKLSTGKQNFMLVTGPNMGGKSVFLKQVGIIQILAQIGCFVPAEQAHLKVMNRIVARSGTSDDNLSSCSSFMWEMKGIASALKRDERFPDQATMFLIDEVGRGTSIDDGASFSFAIAEELALRRDCFTVFATHFDQVFRLSDLYSNVKAYHFDYATESVGGSEDQVVMKLTHTLVSGVSEKSHYGIGLAEACNLPEEIIRIAKEDAGLSI